VFRSWNRASCLRRNRISASRATRGAISNRRTVGKSPSYKWLWFQRLSSRPEFLRSTGSGLFRDYRTGGEGIVGIESLLATRQNATEAF
jgi:hypothetical protein